MIREYRNRFSKQRSTVRFFHNGQEYLLEPLTRQESYILESYSCQPDKIHYNREKFGVEIGLCRTSVSNAITCIMRKWVSPILGEDSSSIQTERLKFAIEMFEIVREFGDSDRKVC
jgi:hypothetical protein